MARLALSASSRVREQLGLLHLAIGDVAGDRDDAGTLGNARLSAGGISRQRISTHTWRDVSLARRTLNSTAMASLLASERDSAVR